MAAVIPNSFAIGAASTASPALGVVVIGRNEGERLRRCLLSLQAATSPAMPAVIVYVDSGSTDGSVAMAASLGARVLELDVTIPFTAARARNAGARNLSAAANEAVLVQFVDGDCEVAPGWIAAASAFLERRSDVVAVCGRRRERFPERSIYNRLCDLEWNTPIGAARACGGDVLMRLAAFERVGGFREELIAGEEPELCVRLRAAGGVIWRLDQEMTLHDAGMTRFSQWWKRSMRGGYAFAEGTALHGAPPERHWVRETRSAWLWGFALPVVLLLGSLWQPAMLAGFLLYPLQVARLYVRSRPPDPDAGKGQFEIRLARAFFLVLGKFSEAAGALKFVVGRLTGNRSRLIEYK